MKSTGMALLIVGIVLLIIGAVVAVVGLSGANSMTWYERDLDPDGYDTYMSMTVVGGVVAVMGLVLTIIGAVVGAEGGTKAPTPIMGQPGQVQVGQAQYGPVAPGVTNFCSYCGWQTAPGALMCPRCGRKL